MFYFWFAVACIEQMQKDHQRFEANLRFQVEDARSMSFQEESFDAIIDKGTIDAIMSGNDVRARFSCSPLVTGLLLWLCWFCVWFVCVAVDLWLSCPV